MMEYKREQFAGFWRRCAALVIDAVIVSFIVLPFAVLIGLAAPDMIKVEVPFGLFTTTEVVSTNSVGGEKMIREDVLGIWTYYYKEKVSVDAFDDETTTRVQVNPATMMEVDKTSSGDIEFFVIFIYWVLFEASRWQASIGKKIMGIRVVNLDGSRPNIFQATARNLMKILSGITLFIGFMMAGWTNKKQALHDMIAQMLVVKTEKAVRDDGQETP